MLGKIDSFILLVNTLNNVEVLMTHDGQQSNAELCPAPPWAQCQVVSLDYSHIIMYFFVTSYLKIDQQLCQSVHFMTWTNKMLKIIISNEHDQMHSKIMFHYLLVMIIMSCELRS